MPKDKVIHLLCGFSIAVLIGFVFSIWAGLVASAVAAAAKELWDSRGHGCVELADACFTVAGGCFGCAAVIAVNMLL